MIFREDVVPTEIFARGVDPPHWRGWCLTNSTIEMSAHQRRLRKPNTRLISRFFVWGTLVRKHNLNRCKKPTSLASSFRSEESGVFTLGNEIDAKFK